MILSNISAPLVGLVDTAVMGRMPDPAYIGAVASGAIVFSVLYWGAVFLRMGTTGLVAQAHGSGDAARIGADVARAALVAVLLGLLLIVLQVPLEWLMFSVWPASAQVESLAAEYLRIRIWGAPLILLQLVANGVLFGLQRPGLTLLLMGVTNVLNVILSIWLVLGLGWGVPGVAVATLCAESLGGVLGVVLVLRALRARGVQAPGLDDLRSLEALRTFGQVSGDLIVRSLALQLAFFLFTAGGARLGDVTLAANAVLMQFFHVLAFGLDGFAHAGEALAGAAWGARNRAALTTSVRYCLYWGGAFALLITALLLAFGPAGIDLLTDLPEVREAARSYLPWIVAMPLVAVWAFLFDGIYIGTTRTQSMRNSMLLSLVVFVVMALALMPGYDNHGLWLAMLVFMGARGGTLGRRWPAHAASLEASP